MAASLAARRGELEEVNRELARATRAAEQAAQAAAARGAELEAVVSALPVAVVVVDPRREILRVNEAACALLGFQGRDLRGCAEALAALAVFSSAGRRLAPDGLPLSRALRGEVVRGEI